MPGAWEQLPFLFVCTLTRETLNYKAAAAREALVLPPRSVRIWSVGKPFDHARNGAAEQAMSAGAEWVFFLDDDMLPPPDCVARLMSHRLPFVSGTYWRRASPLAPVAMRLDAAGNAQWLDTPKPDAGLLPVDYVGAGCLLLHASVFHRVPRPWFQWLADDPDLPPQQRLSEDFAFCKKARFHGLQPFLDPACRCGHIGYAVSAEGGLQV